LGEFIGFDGDSDIDEGNESTFDGTANTQEEDKEPSLDRDLWTLLDNQQGSTKNIDSMIKSKLSDFSGQDQYCSSALFWCKQEEILSYVGLYLVIVCRSASNPKNKGGRRELDTR
jgi:hypothetical protein